MDFKIIFVLCFAFAATFAASQLNEGIFLFNPIHSGVLKNWDMLRGGGQFAPPL